MTLCLGPRPAPSAAPTSPRFNHVTCPPSPALAPFVEHYWLSRWDRRGIPPREAAALLDPCIHLHVQDGRAEVMGVVRSTYRVRIEGMGCVVGVKFRPGLFYPFAQRPATELTDRVIPAENLFAASCASRVAWARELCDAAESCTGDSAAHASIIATHLDAFLGARVPARDASAEQVAELVALIASTAELRRVSDLVRASGRSERTLHRLFARYIGVSPARVIRRFRLKSAAARLTAYPPADVRAVAWDAGYADQAHFIRDFRATIGVTPGAYVQARPQHPGRSLTL
jgi:AraC-like DNA-binding protein